VRGINQICCLSFLWACMTTAHSTESSVKELYSLYCASCHGVKNAEAPEAFNATVWKQRMTKGTDAVLANTIKGLGNMPPQGTCFECTQADLRRLIQFMSGTAGRTARK
jgi:cytochrome c5